MERKLMVRHADIARESPLVLVIDIGSSSTRAALYDATGSIVPRSLVQETCTLTTAADGTAEDDPRALLNRLTRCIDGVLVAAGSRAQQIAAVGCATYVASVLGANDLGQPITPIYTYADTRSAAAARLLREQLDESAIWHRPGCPCVPAIFPRSFVGWPRINHSCCARCSAGRESASGYSRSVLVVQRLPPPPHLRIERRLRVARALSRATGN